MRYFSDRLNARTVALKQSWVVETARTIIGWSPWVPHRACITSPWLALVGSPVLGPPRITFTITHGTSAAQAKPRFSCIREKPGPLVAVIDFIPAKAHIYRVYSVVRENERDLAEAARAALGEARDLILHLDEDATDCRQPVRHHFADFSGGRYRVSGKKTAARGKCAFDYSLVALEKKLASRRSFRCQAGFSLYQLQHKPCKESRLWICDLLAVQPVHILSARAGSFFSWTLMAKSGQ